MSLSILLLKAMVKKSGTMLSHETWDVATLRENASQTSKMPAQKGVSYEVKEYDGVIVDVATPDVKKTDNVIVYIHGGGMVSGDPRDCRSFTSFLAKKYEGRVFGIHYRLAPECKYPGPIEDCMKAFDAIAAENPNAKMTLMGESGGGYLTLATTVMLKQNGKKLPDAIVVLAPLVDWSDDVDRSIYTKDWMVDHKSLADMREAFTSEGDDFKDPGLSPLYADWTGFPPMRVVWDADECMQADCKLILKKAEKENVKLEYKIWKNTCHAVMITMPFMVTEAKKEINNIVDFIRRITE